MMVVFDLFEIAATFIESSLCYQFIGIFVSKPMEKRKRFLLASALTLMICLINFQILFSISTLVLAVLFVPISSRIVFKVSFLKAFSISIFYSCCILLFDFLSMSLLGLLFGESDFAAGVIKDKSWHRCLFLIVSKTLLLLGVEGGKRVAQKHSEWQTGGFVIVTILGYGGILYFSGLTFQYIDINIAITWFLLFIIISLSFCSLMIYVHYKKAESERRMIEIRNEVIVEGYEEISKSYRENACLYHDMKNHINVLGSLLELQKYSEASEYAESLIHAVSALQYTWTGNDVFDCVINLKKGICDSEKIVLQIEADPITMEVDDFTIITIMSNLIDNAIEACRFNQEENRRIYVAIRHINDMLIIKIKNPFSKKIEMVKGEIITGKKNKNEHGWGLKSVSDAVKKAGGVFTWGIEKDEFMANITLFL